MLGLLLLLLLVLMVGQVQVVCLVMTGSSKLLYCLDRGFWTLLVFVFLVSWRYDHATLALIVHVCHLRLHLRSSGLVLPVF